MDLGKWWLRSRWMLLAIVLEAVAVGYAHLDELREVLPTDLYQWLAFLMPVLLAVLRMRSSDQAQLLIRRPPTGPRDRS